MGIDQSLTRTGIVVWAGELVHYREIKTKSSDQLEARLEAMELGAVECFMEFSPVLTYIEGPAPGARVGNDSRPHMVSGVIRLGLWKREAMMDVIAPGTLKKHGTGNGRASKEEMLAAARLQWPECPHHDLADAFFLATKAYDDFECLVEEIT